jgi:hypothetical protein
MLRHIFGRHKGCQGYTTVTRLRAVWAPSRRTAPWRACGPVVVLGHGAGSRSGSRMKVADASSAIPQTDGAEGGTMEPDERR